MSIYCDDCGRRDPDCICAPESVYRDARLPPWPKKTDYYRPSTLFANNDPQARYAEAFYERARAEAAIARLKVAVDALTNIKSHGFHGSSSCASEALAQIEGK